MSETIPEAKGRAGNGAARIDALVASRPELRAAAETHKAVIAAAVFVRGLREQAGFSQRELAERVGTSPAHLSQIERATGRQGPTVELLARVALACGKVLALLTEAEVERLQAEKQAAEGRSHELIEEQGRLARELSATRRRLAATEAELERLRRERQPRPGPQSVEAWLLGIPAGTLAFAPSNSALVGGIVSAGTRYAASASASELRSRVQVLAQGRVGRLMAGGAVEVFSVGDAVVVHGQQSDVAVLVSGGGTEELLGLVTGRTGIVGGRESR